MTSKEIQELDPAAARALRLVRTLAICLLGAVLMLGGAIYFTFSRGESTRNIVTKSACTRDPQSAECAQLREEVARVEPIRNPCISYERVTSKQGRNCPQRFIAHRHPNRSKSTQGFGPGAGDGVQQPSSKGHQPPPPPSSGGDTGKGGGVGKDGSQGPAVPGKGGSGGGSAPPESGPSAQPSREPPAPPANEAAQGAPHPAAEAVEHVEDTVRDAAEGVRESACVLIQSC